MAGAAQVVYTIEKTQIYRINVLSGKNKFRMIQWIVSVWKTASVPLLA